MQFNLGIAAPPIKVTVGSESFDLLHRYLTATERAEAVDAVGRSLSLATEIMHKAILSWTNVTDQNGSPLPFQRLTDTTTGRATSDLDQVMGRLPWLVQLKALLIQYAMNGVIFSRAREVVAPFVKTAAELDALEEELRGFLPTAGGSDSKPSAV